MIAFACVFMLKIAAQYSGLYVDDVVAFELTTRAVRQFRGTPVGKWHLVHLMAEGLEKMIAKRTVVRGDASRADEHVSNRDDVVVEGGGDEGGGFEDGFSFGASSFLNFDTGMLDLDFNGFGF
jgi:hypothetical protein